jgi:hypothetical protein
MFHSETVIRAIHADRVRDLERAARDHRMLAEGDPEPARRPAAAAVQATPAARSACGGSTSGQPA